MKIAFLLGAGCEGSGQLGMPSGNDFKRDTILAQDVRKLVDRINIKSKAEQYDISDGTFLSPNGTSVLYQTIKEAKTIEDFGLSQNDIKIVNKYIKYKEDRDFVKGLSKNDKNKIRDEFRKLYRNELYEAIVNGNKKLECDKTKKLLEKTCFYAMIDSLFNCLREPDKYKKEVGRVVKMYYSAYNSVFNGIAKVAGNIQKDGIKFNDNIVYNRKNLANLLLEAQDKIIKENLENKNLYYNYIKELKNKAEVSVVTTNYTSFAEKLIDLDEEHIAYVHGKMNLFEDLLTKQVKPLQEFTNSEDFIFPYIFVQSGVKPIVSTWQIKEFAKAVKMINEADLVVVLGYGINTDDEHIINILRERLHSDKTKTVYFYYVKKPKNETEKLDNENEIKREDKNIKDRLFSEQIQVYKTSDFKSIIEMLLAEK
ncbi:MAG: hypothetical protein IKW90_04615 [Lachnospiraceae bacterium]|nr:hypothetical protein [Lachnospiraceae bacterium]